MSTGMDVDESNTFLNDSDKDETTQNDQQTQKKTKETKTTRVNRFVGNTNTVMMFPISVQTTEIDIYNMCKKTAKPTLIIMTKSKKLHVTDRESKLFRSQMCYVAFKNATDATSISEKLNRSKLGDMTINVTCTSPSKHNPTELVGKTQWVSITGLKNGVTEQDILDAISSGKKVKKAPTNLFLFQHPQEQTYSGHCILQFQSTSDATKCVKSMNTKKIKGKQVYVTYRNARKGMDKKLELAGKTKRVLIGNVHHQTQPNEITDMCKSFGQIEHVNIWRDAIGYPKGFASVTMATPEEAKAAFEGLEGVVHTNLKLTTAYTQQTSKKAVILRSMKKKLIKNKNVKKKMGNKKTTKKSPMSKKGKDMKKQKKGGRKQFA